MARIHSNAVIHESADTGRTEFGNGSSLGALSYCHSGYVLNNVKIGEWVNIGSNVLISSNVTISNNCIIGDNVQIKEGVVINECCVIDDGVVINRNCLLGPGSSLAMYCELREGTSLEPETVIVNSESNDPSIDGKRWKYPRVEGDDD